MSGADVGDWWKEEDDFYVYIVADEFRVDGKIKVICDFSGMPSSLLKHILEERKVD